MVLAKTLTSLVGNAPLHRSGDYTSLSKHSHRVMWRCTYLNCNVNIYYIPFDISILSGENFSTRDNLVKVRWATTSNYSSKYNSLAVYIIWALVFPEQVDIYHNNCILCNRLLYFIVVQRPSNNFYYALKYY